MNWPVFIPFGAVTVILAVMAVFLLRGRGAFLIAGYNTMSPAKKARYDEKALCRCVGRLLLAVAACLALVPAGVQFNLPWLVFTGLALTLAVILGFLIYANTGKRFLKQGSDISELDMNSHPAAIIATVSVAVIALVGVCVLTFSGARDPVVNVRAGGIEIKTMYGLDIAFSEISDISLLGQSMADIGVGMRTNGYGGLGQALKGHFRLSDNSEALLFVQADSAPTIKIARGGGQTVYVSFKDAETTRALYDEIGGIYALCP